MYNMNHPKQNDSQSFPSTPIKSTFNVQTALCLDSYFINHYIAPCTFSFVSTTTCHLCNELACLTVSLALNICNHPLRSAEGSQSSRTKILHEHLGASSPGSPAWWKHSPTGATWCSGPQDLVLCDWRTSPYPDREDRYFLWQPLLQACSEFDKAHRITLNVPLPHLSCVVSHLPPFSHLAYPYQDGTTVGFIYKL